MGNMCHVINDVLKFTYCWSIWYFIFGLFKIATKGFVFLPHTICHKSEWKNLWFLHHKFLDFGEKNSAVGKLLSSFVNTIYLFWKNFGYFPRCLLRYWLWPCAVFFCVAFFSWNWNSKKWNILKNDDLAATKK